MATSGVTFFRTLGSSFGAAVFGTVYANVLSDTLPAAVAASPGVDPAAVATPEALHAYPADQIAPIVEAYAHAMHVVFLARRARAAGGFRARALPQGGPAARYGARAPPATSARASACRRAPTRSSSCRSRSPACSSTRAAPTCRSSASAPARPSDRRTAGRSGRSTCAPGSAGPPPSRRSAGATTCRPRSSSPPSRTPPSRGYLGATDGGLAAHRARPGRDRQDHHRDAGLARGGAQPTGAPTTPQLAAALGDLATRFVEESPELTAEPSALAIGGGRS